MLPIALAQAAISTYDTGISHFQLETAVPEKTESANFRFHFAISVACQRGNSFTEIPILGIESWDIMS
jgi:hypothetical protein